MIQQAMHIGLRFDRNQAPALLELADRARLKELARHEVALFALAAEAAVTGEPLIIACANPLEAILIAKGYGRYGIREPVIEQVQGGGGPPNRGPGPR